MSIITLDLPADLELTPDQVAKKINKSRATVIRALNKPKTDRYFLKGSKDNNNGPWGIKVADLADYLNRRSNDYERN